MMNAEWRVLYNEGYPPMTPIKFCILFPALFVLCACHRNQPKQVSVTSAIHSLEHAESLRQIQLPNGPSLVGVYEEGLRAYLAFDMPADALDAFLAQPLFKQLSVQSADMPTFDPDLKWWQPSNGKIVARLNGILPTKRALDVTVTNFHSNSTGQVRVFVYKGNI